MPSTYAHYRFGVVLLPTLPGDVRRTIQRFRRLFDVGLHGPDIFYFQNSVLKSSGFSLGIKYHEMTGKALFPRLCRLVRLERSEAVQAYLYGLLCHYCLDARLHPIITRNAEAGCPTALRIEAEFDRFLLEKDGKVPPCTQDLTPHLKLTPGEWETVAKFYPPATARTVRDSLQSMTRLLKSMTVPEGARRTLLSKSLTVFGTKLRDMMIPAEPDPDCTQLNPVLMRAFQTALDDFPGLLTQLQANITYSAPFEKEFEPPFG